MPTCPPACLANVTQQGVHTAQASAAAACDLAGMCMQAKRWAADPDSPYYSSFKACSRAPWPDGSEHTFVMGAWGE